MAASSVVQVWQLSPSATTTFYSLTGGLLASTFFDGIRSNKVYGSSDLGWQDMGTVNTFSDILSDATNATYIGNIGQNTVSFYGGVTGADIYTRDGCDSIYAYSDMEYSNVNLGNAGSTVDQLYVFGKMSNSNIIGWKGTQAVSIDGDVSGSTFDLGSGNDSLTVSGNITGCTISLKGGSDSLIIGGAVTNSTIDMAWGKDTLIMGGVVTSTTILLGSGADTVIFTGALDGTTINLGTDTNIDTVIIDSLAALSFGRPNMINGANDGDILRAGATDYVYNSTAGGFVNGSTVISF